MNAYGAMRPLAVTGKRVVAGGESLLGGLAEHEMAATNRLNIRSRCKPTEAG